MNKKLTEVLTKHLTILAYLLGSGVIAFLLSFYVLKDEKLTILLAPMLNYLAFILKKELEGSGVRAALK